MAMTLRDRDKKFSGDVGECWQEYVDEYRQVLRDYNLTPAQKLQYLHNLLRRDAKRFYLDTVEGYATNFDQIISMIEREYNSIVRQKEVKNFLKSLGMRNYVSEGMDIAVALEKVYKLILKVARQVPIAHRGDAHRVEYLSLAVAGYVWTTEPLASVAISGLNFQQLYGELESQLQLSREAETARQKDEIFSRNRNRHPDHQEDVPGILFAGQGRYARRPSTVRFNRPTKTSTVPAGKREGRFDPLTVTGCFNCGELGHMVKNCNSPLHVARATAGRLDYYSQKQTATQHNTHHVLAELRYQLDFEEQIGETDEKIEPEMYSDGDVFENVISNFEA